MEVRRGARRAERRRRGVAVGVQGSAREWEWDVLAFGAGNHEKAVTRRPKEIN